MHRSQYASVELKTHSRGDTEARETGQYERSPIGRFRTSRQISSTEANEQENDEHAYDNDSCEKLVN